MFWISDGSTPVRFLLDKWSSVIRGGALELQTTHSQWAGLQGSPSSCVPRPPGTMALIALRAITSWASALEAICTYLLISMALRIGPLVESGVFTNENDRTKSKVTFM
uniref:Uncharacterized protein n=1 Tax=Opuntia streptacantha TaxID=393608 RepID=A0A7C9DNQ7_OPUST